MKRAAVTFGASRSLVGILTEPDAATRAPHVLILNAGIVHRVGPGGIFVEMSRRLAEIGIASLRYDSAGIGDSPPRVPPVETVASAVADAREAMDYLSETRGAHRFVTLGLCSGGRLAHSAAAADPRIVGAVVLDGAVYSTPRSSLEAAAARLRKPRALLAGAVRRVSRQLSSTPSAPFRGADPDFFFSAIPAKEQMAHELRALAARGVQLLYAYSGEWRGYRYEGQLHDAFPGLGLASVLTERRIASADHLYCTRPERAALMTLVGGWLQERYS